MDSLTPQELAAMYRDTPMPLPDMALLEHIHGAQSLEEVLPLVDAYFESQITVYPAHIQAHLRGIYADPFRLTPDLTLIQNRRGAAAAVVATPFIDEHRPELGKRVALDVETGWPEHYVQIAPSLHVPYLEGHNLLRHKTLLVHELNHIGQILSRFEQAGAELFAREFLPDHFLMLMEMAAALNNGALERAIPLHLLSGGEWLQGFRSDDSLVLRMEDANIRCHIIKRCFTPWEGLLRLTHRPEGETLTAEEYALFENRIGEALLTRLQNAFQLPPALARLQAYPYATAVVFGNVGTDEFIRWASAVQENPAVLDDPHIPASRLFQEAAGRQPPMRRSA